MHLFSYWSTFSSLPSKKSFRFPYRVWKRSAVKDRQSACAAEAVFLHKLEKRIPYQVLYYYAFFRISIGQYSILATKKLFFRQMKIVYCARRTLRPKTAAILIFCRKKGKKRPPPGRSPQPVRRSFHAEKYPFFYTPSTVPSQVSTCLGAMAFLNSTQKSSWNNTLAFNNAKLFRKPIYRLHPFFV